MTKQRLKIYDCTLRDGEQADGARFDLDSRVSLFRALDDFGVDYVELGWPASSEDIIKAFRRCKSLARKSELSAFGSTSKRKRPVDDENLAAILKSGAGLACIFGKTCLTHVNLQLRVSPDENLDKISESVEFLRRNGLKVFYDAEHYFDAYLNNPSYAIDTLVRASEAGAETLVLCDTKGGMMPQQVERIMRETRQVLRDRGVATPLGMHAHNDCELALANTLAALPYVSQVQGTMNGMGERVGNLNLTSFLALYGEKKLGDLRIDIRKLKVLNDLVYRCSGLPIPVSDNRCFVGRLAFAHRGGVHVDALRKGHGGMYEHAHPERFGNHRIIALNTLGGLAAIEAVARDFGHTLDKKDAQVAERAKQLYQELGELENRGYRIGTLPAEHFLLIEKYFGNPQRFFEIGDAVFHTEKVGGREYSKARFNFEVAGRSFADEQEVLGGPVHAAFDLVQKVLGRYYSRAGDLSLVDFNVGIARYLEERSLVRTCIQFKNSETFECVGVDENILISAKEAVEKGFRYHLQRAHREGKL